MAVRELARRVFGVKEGVVLSPTAREALQALDQPVTLVQGSTVFETMAGSYGALFNAQPAIRQVVGFRARNIAQLNIKAYRRIANTNRKELPDHPAIQQLHRPNPYTTQYRMTFALVADLDIYDNAFWLKMRVGSVLALVRIPPEIVRVHGSQYSQPTAYTIVPTRQFGDATTFTVDPSAMIHFRGFDPTDSRLGSSTIRTLRAIIDEDVEARNYRRVFWRRAARMEGVIQRPMEAPEWSDDAKKRFRQDWQNAMSGTAASGKTGILEEGMTFQPYSFSSKGNEWIEGRKLTLEEVARAYFVPPSMLGLAGSPTTIVEEHKMLYQDALGPTLEMIEQELELQLLPEFDDIAGVYLEFNLADKLKGSFEEQANVITTAAGGPWLTRNEARARQNLPPIPGGDEIIVPLNVAIGGGPQPAPGLPTADPSTPLPAGQAALPETRTKAAIPAGVLRRRDIAAKLHEQVFRRTFERQRAAVQRGGKATIDVARWDKELTADLHKVAMQTTADAGTRAASQIGGTYDIDRTDAYLLENARIAAESVNGSTRDLLRDAGSDHEAIAGVFDVAEGSRATQLGIGRATALIAFARHEAAAQNPSKVKTKTWVVTSGNSRHPELDGETVKVFQAFSNGGQYPGDPLLPADEAAHCECLLQLGG